MVPTTDSEHSIRWKWKWETTCSEALQHRLTPLHHDPQTKRRSAAGRAGRKSTGSLSRTCSRVRSSRARQPTNPSLMSFLDTGKRLLYRWSPDSNPAGSPTSPLRGRSSPSPSLNPLSTPPAPPLTQAHHHSNGSSPPSSLTHSQRHTSRKDSNPLHFLFESSRRSRSPNVSPSTGKWRTL